MEFGQRRRDGYYCEEDEEGNSRRYHHHRPQETLSFLPPPSSSSSTSSSPTRWTSSHTDNAADHEPSGSGGGSDAPEPPPVPVSQIEKEHMFHKVVTPSDVGKLNRLVIPKQHAEKYFPFDSSTNVKGLLLNFEDREGKPWRFRYSYWNSSQSYVMTKGWSRFVKEKRLDAGDTVSFGRGVGEAGRDRLFIDWKRRPEPPQLDRSRMPYLQTPSSYNHMMSFGGWSRLFAPPPTAVSVYDHHRQRSYGYNAPTSPYFYLRSAATGGPSQVGVQYGSSGSATGGGSGGAGTFGTIGPPVVFEAPVASNAYDNKTAYKRIRLFGVNLDSKPVEDGDSPAASQVRQMPPFSPLQLSLGAAATASEKSESPGKDKQPMSLDLDV